VIASAAPYSLGALARVSAAELPWSIIEIGLSSVAPQRQPEIGGGSDNDRPLDRSVVDRVRATLRRALNRDALPTFRCCAPRKWTGPVHPGHTRRGQTGHPGGRHRDRRRAGTVEPGRGKPVRAGAQIQARLRKEAYVLHARRYLVEGGPIHPRQRQVVEDLGAYAQPYLSRLWARLHGRDVWQEPCDDVDDVRSLLEGSRGR